MIAVRSLVCLPNFLAGSDQQPHQLMLLKRQANDAPWQCSSNVQQPHRPAVTIADQQRLLTCTNDHQ